MSNQVAVKKSQVQVAIVKSEELKSKIAEIEASHKQLQLDLDNAERERLTRKTVPRSCMQSLSSWNKINQQIQVPA